MSYLKNIVKFIDDHLTRELLGQKCFSNKKLAGIAQRMTRVSDDVAMIMPCFVNDDGEGEYVGPDCTYSLMTYHRVNTMTTAPANVRSFGDSQRAEGNRADMSMVVFARRDMLRLSSDDLAIKIQSAFPEALEKEIRLYLKLYAANISIQNIILSDLQVFREEYENVAYFLKPEQFLLKVNYTIESAFDKGCFTTCE